ncbi:hypothetical protein [Fulvivirga lutea]|uniref:Lipoprotein n=1 Tax=Fulvivirga lutea TaxID=2810512 RepID=A0A974WNG0_9BACT|nr:hypothetical protein [Fulvivirga lutea]QSE98703.1 hypothetical protein JR347_06380 [Fulvivirga lutea]
MKNSKSLIIGLFVLAACDSPYRAPAPVTETTELNQPFLNEIAAIAEQLDTTAVKANLNGENFGLKVDIYDEMLELFHPDKLTCGLSDKIRKRLKESTRSKKEKNGYVPDIVVNNTSEYKDAIKLDGRGANVLVHYFTYELDNGEESKPIISKDTPTQESFNVTQLIDNQNDAYESFIFTMDCSGYFSAAAKAAASGGFLGFGKGSVAAEGEKTINQSQSVVVMRALIYSPLYAAYDGSFIYKINEEMKIEDKRRIYQNRLQTLNGVINAIPNSHQFDSMRVFLNSNYEAIITSNKGNSGYNGTGKLNSNVELSFTIAQASGNIEASNSVSRKSEYSSYDTYIIEANKDVIPEELTLKKLNDKVEEIENLIENIDSPQIDQPNT